jgi:hypothetical protein
VFVLETISAFDSNFWIAVYRQFMWFGKMYRYLQDGIISDAAILRSAFDYRVDENGVLSIMHLRRQDEENTGGDTR